ncbi:MAG: class I SAM-dependent methyltransferase [Deltaproteobacteria bacterium]|nr:class I SAM-dependent methyltransferase [Deltaproteobacteria bacterium]
MGTGGLTGVSKTAILTLRARADEHERADRFFEDPWARDWIARIEWPPELDAWYSARAQHFLAARADELDGLARAHLSAHPDGRVLELGAGLSSRSLRLEHEFERARFLDLDLEPVIELRRSLAGESERRRHIGASVTELGWLEAFESEDPRALLIIAEGLFYYLPRAEVLGAFDALGAKLQGASVAFDVVGEMDFPETSARASAVGAGLAWMHESPFERAWTDFCLDEVPGFGPAELMERAIDRYWARLGSPTRELVRALSRSPALAGGRSGVVYGTLRARR